MLPGYVAGFYTRAPIDLARLAAFAGARLVHAEAVGLDWREKRVLLRGRPAVAYDVLSIDIGITPRGAHVVAAPARCRRSWSVKPIDGFCARWDAIVARVRTAARRRHAAGRQRGAPPVRIVVVGGGAGGVELALSIEARLARELRVIKRKAAARRRPAGGRGRPRGPAREHRRVEVTVIARSAQLLPRHGARVRDAFAALHQRGAPPTALGRGGDVRRRGRGAHGERRGGGGGRGDLVHAGGDAGVAARDSSRAPIRGGFIAVQDTLESTNVPSVFAAGDVASVLEHPRPKAGVAPCARGRRSPTTSGASCSRSRS